MKFDFCIGNPPYQESGDTNNKAEALYPYFYDIAETIADKYMLISPARFLFNAGLTSKEWNNKMLQDTHLKVEDYYNNSADVFKNTNINGGVAILYRDNEKEFQAIQNFIPDKTLRQIAGKFDINRDDSLAAIMYGGRSDLKFNDAFLADYPDTKDFILKVLQKKHPQIKSLAPGEEYEIKSSSFERTPYAFSEDVDDSNDYYKIMGVENGKRTGKWVKKEYLTPRYFDNNIDSYKAFISKADGAAGQIGKPIPARIIGKPDFAGPNVSFMPTFISIGRFDTQEEAENICKYLRTKLVRALIGILKVTQDITPEKCRFVPLQDFSCNSDIDWTKPIPEIDGQLYRKYGLTSEEIDFIETHVKEMV